MQNAEWNNSRSLNQWSIAFNLQIAINIVWRQKFLPSIAWKVSWALPSGVRRRDKIQNWAASHVAQNQSSDSHLLNWKTNPSSELMSTNNKSWKRRTQEKSAADVK